MSIIRIGARSSPLSLAQVRLVSDQLTALGLQSEFVSITTQGDVDRRALTVIGGTGVFAAAVRVALSQGQIDLAVHSAKDLPTTPAPGLAIAAYLARDDVRDVLVGARLVELAHGARVGTGSPRRAVQLRAWAASQEKKLEIVDIRGNVASRLGQVGTAVDAVILAAAGLRRLELLRDELLGAEPSTSGAGIEVSVAGHRSEVLSPEVMLPAPAQGAIAVEMRADDPRLSHISELNEPATSVPVSAERAFLARLEAGCSSPAAAWAQWDGARTPAADVTLRVVAGEIVHEPGNSPHALTNAGADLASALISASGQGSSLAPEDLGIQLADQVLNEQVRLNTATPTPGC